MSVAARPAPLQQFAYPDDGRSALREGTPNSPWSALQLCASERCEPIEFSVWPYKGTDQSLFVQARD